ncbi:hypothetical protein NQ317_000368, partial [Molorchus minor]
MAVWKPAVGEFHKSYKCEDDILGRLLYSVLPVSVANELRHKRPVPARRYDSATLLFSGIVGFSTYCTTNADSRGAMKIVKMLNELYTKFDDLTDSEVYYNIYK